LLILQRVHGSGFFFGTRRNDFIKRRDRMPGSQLARVFFVIIEIFSREHPFFIPNQAIGLDLRGIELDLEFHVLRDREKRGPEFLHQYFLGFHNGIDIKVVTVALIGQLLHLRIFDIPRSESEHRQENAVRTLRFDQAYHLCIAGCADIKISVCSKNDAVIAAFDEILFGDLIRKLNPLAARGRTAGAQILDRHQDLALFRAGRRWQNQSCIPCIGHDRDLFLVTQLIRQFRECGLQEQ